MGLWAQLLSNDTDTFKFRIIIEDGMLFSVGNEKSIFFGIIDGVTQIR